MPLPLLLMLPASLIVSLSLNFLGGAKSRPVKVDDLRSEWLQTHVSELRILQNGSSPGRSDLRAGKGCQLIKRGDQGRRHRQHRRVRPPLAQRALGTTRLMLP